MLPRNLLIVSVVVFLATTVSTAPVEEKEREEAEAEAAEEAEEELSEEEEDDDDSKSQDKIQAQQPTTPARGLGVSVGPGLSSHAQDAGAASIAMGSDGGAAAGSPGAGPSNSATSQIQAGAGSSSVGSPLLEGAIAGVSAGQTEAAGPGPPTALSVSQVDPNGGSPAADLALQAEPPGYDTTETDSNGNGHKLLNGAEGGTAAGALELFGGGASHLDYTGVIDQSSHDFLIGLMGGVDPFIGPDAHIDITDHPAPASHPETTVLSSDPSLAADSGPFASSLDTTPAPGDPALHIDQSGVDQTSMNSGSDQSSSSSVSGSSFSAGHGEGIDSADMNGNGRQTVLTDTPNGGGPVLALAVGVSQMDAVTDGVLSLSSLHSDLTGGAESVTGLQMDLTASGLGMGQDVTGDSSSILLHTEAPGQSSFTHTMNSVSGEYSHTDLVTMATDMLTDTNRAAGDAVTEHTQVAGSATEQYHPSGPGTQGAENVELEDTC